MVNQKLDCPQYVLPPKWQREHPSLPMWQSASYTINWKTIYTHLIFTFILFCFSLTFLFDALISLQISSDVPAPQSLFLHSLLLFFALAFCYKSFSAIMWKPVRSFTLWSIFSKAFIHLSFYIAYP